MRHCARLPFHYSYLLPSEIGGFRLRSSKEESASCEEMDLRNGVIVDTCAREGISDSRYTQLELSYICGTVNYKYLFTS